jgi:hypothetical protein
VTFLGEKYGTKSNADPESAKNDPKQTYPKQTFYVANCRAACAQIQALL